MGQVWKKIMAGVAAVLTVALVYFFWLEGQEEKRLQEESLELENELRPLELEQTRLRLALDDLEEAYEEEDRGVGNVILLFTNLEEQIYTEIYPLMAERGLVGVLAISGDQYPGLEGCLSDAQFGELLEAGWSCCLKWETGMGLWEWLSSCERMSKETDTERPRTVYFSPGTYDSGKDRFLASRNFLAVIHHGEEDRPLVVSGSDEKIWYLGAVGWNQDEVYAQLSDAIEQRGNLVLTVGSGSEEEEYFEEDFLGMLNWIQKRCGEGDLMTMDPLQLREYQQEMADRRMNLEDVYEEQKAEMEEQLEILKQEINRLTQQYLEKCE